MTHWNLAISVSCDSLYCLRKMLIRWINFAVTPAAKSAMIISIFMSFLNNFCGSFVMLNYTTAIFEEAGSTLTANQSSIVVAFVQLFANLMTIILVEKAGRKLLYLISIFGCIVGLVSMGCFSVFKVHLQEHSWIPMVSFAVVVLMASIGMRICFLLSIKTFFKYIIYLQVLCHFNTWSWLKFFRKRLVFTFTFTFEGQKFTYFRLFLFLRR